MKINWGWGLALGMVAFILFIMYFVVTMTTSKEFDHDLVTEDYYAKEMVYQQEIDAEKNVQQLDGKVKSERNQNGWQISFPNSVDPTKIKGTAFLYRPSNEKLDFEIPLNLETGTLVIPAKQLIEGRWNITIDWEYEGKPYLYKESITY
jgi:nitrogen fixation protein FixH